MVLLDAAEEAEDDFLLAEVGVDEDDGGAGAFNTAFPVPLLDGAPVECVLQWRFGDAEEIWLHDKIISHSNKRTRNRSA
ncbi:hypothetical protein ZHAS_00018141 [Anopheles sinensis]|uniref:Uncharacterized protein n=1 Tax=Anopheles sinensis TaxID=74873 RepID=A0A084WIP5_ANOSI|nr:hypothetical protein ZHAS_00018141 [Anopheles sinensis]